MTKFPDIHYFHIVEIWPKELEDAVKEYCSSVLKMTFEEKRRQVIEEFREKLFNAAMEYKKTKEEIER